MSNISFNSAIFREYDIRGIYNKDFNSDFVKKLGIAFSNYLKEKLKRRKIALSIGRDNRLSSPEIYNTLSKSLTENGINLINLGVCPIPVYYFSLHTLDVNGGIMITASHNPKDYNGFILNSGTEEIYGKELKKLKNYLKGNLKNSSSKGEIRNYNILKDYKNFLLKQFSSFDGIKVVIDSGNGTAGLIAPELFKKLNADLKDLYSTPDGNFPNHHPDPTIPENLKDLIEKVKEEKAYLGIAYDLDADRIGVVDEKGKIIPGDLLLLIFARNILKRHRGAKIIGEVKCSQILFDEINKMGGKAIMWKTGHSLIKAKIREERALLAGEMSGHIYFADRYYGFDDAIYSSLRLMEILSSEKEKKLSRFLKGIKKMYSTPEIRIPCNDNLKFKIVERMKEEFKNYKAITIDGVRIQFNNGWALIRASNTQPALVLRFEAESRKKLKEIRELVEGKLKEIMP